MPRNKASDAGEQKLLDDVTHYGWHCLHILGVGEHQPFSYTVGLFQTHGYPELLLYGLSRETAHAVFSIAAKACSQGHPLDLESPTAEFLEGYPCVFVPVPRSAYPDHVGFARWYYEGDGFPVRQIVFPSKTGHFPWDAAATNEFRKAQPVLGDHSSGA